MLLTDGPFIDSKEYLAGLFLIKAGNLDGALAIAGELLQQTRPGTAIEVRPILGGRFRGAPTPSSATSGAACWPHWSASWATSNSQRKSPQRLTCSSGSGS